MSAKNLNTIINLLLELASGNLEAKGKISPRNDDYDAIITGINILTEELQQTTVSKDYLSSIYKGIADMLFILDKNENVKELNEAALASLQIKDSLIIGNPFRNLFLEPSLFDLVFPNLKKQGFQYNIENTLVSKQGNTFQVSCTATVLRDKNEKVTGYLFIAKDISKIKKTEEELKLKNKELDTFLYKAAHDLKSPITSIQGILNIAKMEIQDPTALNYFELIRQCSTKLDYILTTLKDTVEMDISGLGLEKIHIDTIIDEVLMEVQKSNFYNEKVLITKKIKQPFPIYTKSKSLNFTLTQVLLNAYKFQKQNEQGVIDITVYQHNDSTYISVTDNGVGIQKKYQANLFDMFYKANNLYEGAGLGLYSAQSIMSKIGGKIEVESQLSKGSTFTISFKSIFNDFNF